LSQAWPAGRQPLRACRYPVVPCAPPSAAPDGLPGTASRLWS